MNFNVSLSLLSLSIFDLSEARLGSAQIERETCFARDFKGREQFEKRTKHRGLIAKMGVTESSVPLSGTNVISIHSASRERRRGKNVDLLITQYGEPHSVNYIAARMVNCEW